MNINLNIYREEEFSFIDDVHVKTIVNFCLNYMQNFCGRASCIELSISFVGSEKICSLNKEYRQIDKPTDVLTFAFGGFIMNLFDK
ncbi:MAG: rRNA maturation RNAse YbeY, partial [Coriobacteriales bacterium]|nr:rRNA maturation RNAse YbeY [Coriobacteriales bacterium]